ncbi:ribosomal protein L13 [Ancylostoma ceylanicum]|uniref:Ribosomal protein L13 n=1 Tax=Ancylostoma ceylanicum TaxID=53326 RepID=A0A0D6LZP6_9BILA|nr:ribosomal protein L13 [Ancylostoma ceylanicum]
MAARRALSRFERVNQWLQFARQWHIVDANHQDAFLLGKHVAKHLSGQHKPIWHPETDCGDHVVVVNCRHVAMHGFDWKHTLFHFNKEYPRSKADIPAWQIHEYDPCRIVFLAVYKLEQVQRIPRRSDEYTEEERKRFPKLLRFPANHVEEWKRSIPNPGRYEKNNPAEKK